MQVFAAEAQLQPASGTKTIAPQWRWIEIPDHQGVATVGGRVGAADGPRVFAEVFQHLKGRCGEISLAHRSTVKNLTLDVRHNLEAAAQHIGRLIKQDPRIPSVIIGGGHDHGFSHLKGIAEGLGTNPACINIDAHLDVRPPLEPGARITSGSPFYLALEEGVLAASHFIEFGIQTHCNAPDLWSYIERKKIKVRTLGEVQAKSSTAFFRKDLAALAKTRKPIVISLDLDAAAEAYAPGVSAPQAEGFSSTELIEFCRISGRHPQVVSLGLFELNPEHDRHGQTARLAATCAWHFLAARFANQKNRD